MHTKSFRNTASNPMVLSVTVAYNAEGIVTRVLASGGVGGMTAEQRAEAMRMFSWAKATFVGQHFSLFSMHNGVIPVPPRISEDEHDFRSSFAARPHDQPGKSESGPLFYLLTGDMDFLMDRGTRRYAVVDEDFASLEAQVAAALAYAQFSPSVDISEVGAKKLAEAMMRNSDWLKGAPLGGRLHRNESVDERVYTKQFDRSPAFSVNSYWQSRTEPTKFYRVTDVQACSGHFHVEMHCLQDGEPYDRVWVDDKQWSDIFIHVDRNTALAPLSPQSKRGPYAEFFDPAVLEERDASAPVIAATQRVLDGVEFTGTEVPPAVGEQYQRVDSDKVFTVLAVQDVTHGIHMVTLESGAGTTEVHRFKAKFRDHAQWLAKWRPVDSEGGVKPVVFIDIETEAAGRVMDAESLIALDKAAAEEVRESILHTDGNAERWIRIIGRELDRRVPDWRDYDPPGVLYDDCALIIRAIRTLFHGGMQAKADLLAHKDALKEVEALAETRSRNVEKRDVRIRELEDASREMLRDVSVHYKNRHGVYAIKTLMEGFGYPNIMQIPVNKRREWVSLLLNKL